MKALWLHQPYPTLIALGVKHWETRGGPPNGPMRPDGVRGMPGLAIESGERIAIVAGKKAPSICEVGAWDVMPHVSDSHVAWGGTALHPGDWYTYERPNPPGRVHKIAVLPLGVVVCTAVVSEALPMVGASICPTQPHIAVTSDRLRRCDGSPRLVDITDQLPYGDWRPGRWAWRLTDVKQVPAGHEPNVVRGNRQGVCEIEVTW